MKYWIQDEDSTPQGFPLKALALNIIQLLGSASYQLFILRSQGYGQIINEWDEYLDKKETLLVNPELFLDISSGEEEWFYDLDIEIIADGQKIQFGLHDSTALYIEAPQEFAKNIIKSFKQARKAYTP